MFNGIVETRLLRNPKSELMKHVASVNSFPEKCDVIFMSVLSRSPTDEERAAIAAMQESDDARRIQYLIWALVNSQDFIFVQ